MLVLMIGIAFLGHSLTQSEISYQMSVLPIIASPQLACILEKKIVNISPVGVFECLDLSAVRKIISISLKPFAGIYAVVNLVNGKMYVGSASQGRIFPRFA